MPTCFVVNLDDNVIIAEIYGDQRTIAKSFLESERKANHNSMLRELDGGDYEIVQCRKQVKKVGNNKLSKSEWVPAFLITANKPESVESISKWELPEINVKKILKEIGLFGWMCFTTAFWALVDLINRNNKF